MPTITLKLIRPPADDTQEQREAAKPLLRGVGDTDYLCGNCGGVIASGLAANQRVPYDSTVCPACGAENEFPPSLRA